MINKGEKVICSENFDYMSGKIVKIIGNIKFENGYYGYEFDYQGYTYFLEPHDFKIINYKMILDVL